MSHLQEAISRYNKILEAPPHKDLSWVKILHERMETERLSAGGRLLCPFLRPNFVTRRQYESMVRTGEALISAIERMEQIVLASPALLSRMPLLPAEKIAAFKKQPCTLLHVWATWCTICIQEMPDLVKVLNVEKSRVRPIIIDASSPFQQDNFSKKYMATLKPQFTTYVKPGGDDDKYLNAIDKGWSGSLPFSALYHKGKRQKVWNGSIDLSRFKDDIATNCQ